MQSPPSAAPTAPITTRRPPTPPPSIQVSSTRTDPMLHRRIMLCQWHPVHPCQFLNANRPLVATLPVRLQKPSLRLAACLPAARERGKQRRMKQERERRCLNRGKLFWAPSRAVATLAFEASIHVISGSPAHVIEEEKTLICTLFCHLSAI